MQIQEEFLYYDVHPMEDGYAKIRTEVTATVLTSVPWGFCSKTVILKSLSCCFSPFTFLVSGVEKRGKELAE